MKSHYGCCVAVTLTTTSHSLKVFVLFTFVDADVDVVSCDLVDSNVGKERFVCVHLNSQDITSTLENL